MGTYGYLSADINDNNNCESCEKTPEGPSSGWTKHEQSNLNIKTPKTEGKRLLTELKGELNFLHLVLSNLGSSLQHNAGLYNTLGVSLIKN
jgi:hypothetical protein